MHPDADALFDLPTEDFVAARDALAARLRGSGEREAAKAVAALRRPTVAAWAVNRIARDEPGLLDAVADAGADLRHAQRRALSGIREAGMTQAARARRAAVDAATAAALRLTGSQAHAAEISATFEAAAAAADVAKEVARGRLTRPLPPPDAFGDVAGLTLVRDPDPDPGAATGDADEAARAERRAAEEVVERARAAHGAAVEAARRAGSAHRDQQTAARAAAAEVERLSAELERLTAALESARAAAADAQAAVEHAADEAADADLAVRKRLSELESAESAHAALDAE